MGALENCTHVTPECPVEGTTYGYTPNLAANIILLAVFAICNVAQSFLGAWYRLWSFGIVVSMGCLCEWIGYVGRVSITSNGLEPDLVFQTYAARRRILETCVKSIPTKAMLSNRCQIDMSGPDPHAALQSILAEHLASHLEGLVLKAEESEYNEFRLPWVKLKKDYIPGFGDCVDLIIVAAGWDRDRARDLRGAHILEVFSLSI